MITFLFGGTLLKSPPLGMLFFFGGGGNREGGVESTHSPTFVPSGISYSIFNPISVYLFYMSIFVYFCTFFEGGGGQGGRGDLPHLHLPTFAFLASLALEVKKKQITNGEDIAASI